jgi:peptide/nickel transport system substrate-binding protein
VSTRRTTGRRWRTAKFGTAAVAVLTLGVASACSSTPSSSSSSTPSSSASATGSSGSSSAITSFPRNETLYTDGTVGSPPSTWNPLNVNNYETGAQGLIYEPLNLYNPEASGSSAYMPWLATNTPSTGWQGDTYVIDVRSGVKWSNGTPLTAADVAWNINLAATNANDPYNVNAATVKKATVSGNTVVVTFKGTPGYTEFNDYLWKAPVLPESIWSKIPASQIATWADTTPVGTGPMTLYSYTTTDAAYETNPDWWGTSALGLSFKFKYLVDEVDGTNDQDMGQVMGGDIDWSNNFLPGINQVSGALGGNAGYTLKFYYPGQPYMLSGNTVWLEPNTTKAPMNNVNFRRALAYALNPTAIAETVYGGLAKAANPTGLLPNLDSYVDQSVVSQYAATYDPSKAESLLKASGYNGAPITLIAPAGWSDWDDALGVIQSELKAVGIDLQTVEPTATVRSDDMASGNYDLVLDNDASLDSSPWSYFQRVYQLPITATDSSDENVERYTSQADWSLVQQAGSTVPTDTSKLQGVYDQLEKDFLQQQPEIPLWYNGIWFQGNTTYWQNYPSSSGSDQYIPAMWRGYIGALTTVYALANLEPNPAAPKS